MLHIRILFTFSLLLFCRLAVAQFNPGIDTLFLLNPNPTETDSIQLEVHITLPTLSVFDTATTELAGDTIKLDLSYCGGLLTAIDKIIDTVTLGILPAGSYFLRTTVNELRRDINNPDSCIFLDQYSDTLQFEVDFASAASTVQKTNLKLYPNPVKEMLYLESAIGIREISIFSVEGRRNAVWQYPNTPRQVQLSWRGLPQGGMYWLRLRLADGSMAVRKVVVGF